MNSGLFLTFLFLPFLFFIYLVVKRIFLSAVNKNILNYGLSVCVFLSLIISVISEYIKTSEANMYLIAANAIFLLLSILTVLFFKFKKQFMFTHLRFNTFLSLLISLTYLYILSNSFIFSALLWIFSGILIYIFSYFDIFKTGSDYNSNRFYSLFLTGDFCLLLSVLIFVKFALISDNYSSVLRYDDIGALFSYIMGNGEYEYYILIACIIFALFSRAFIFPFSSCFSFLANSSNIFYLTIYSTVAPLYSLILFLKLDLFESLHPYIKIYFMSVIAFILIMLLFEKHFKIIFGYLLSVVNTLFILGYFYNKDLAFIILFISYALLTCILFILFMREKLSFKRRIINVNTGFLQERFSIFVYEKLPVHLADVIEFFDKRIIRNIYGFLCLAFDIVSYYYMRFIQKKEIFSIIKGILIVFTFFALLAIFIALFGNFGEMQS